MPKGGSATKRGGLYKKITAVRKKTNQNLRKIEMHKQMRKNKSRLYSA